MFANFGLPTPPPTPRDGHGKVCRRPYKGGPCCKECLGEIHQSLSRDSAWRCKRLLENGTKVPHSAKEIFDAAEVARAVAEEARVKAA